MTDSPVVMDPAFSIPSTKTVPNGHVGSHDMAATTGASTNGVVPDLSSTPASLNSFEDCFMDFDTNYDETEDAFADDLELERIRHLSTIVEGPAENSNSSSDNEESDYVHLSDISFHQSALNPGHDLPSTCEEDTDTHQTAIIDSRPEINTDFIPDTLPSLSPKLSHPRDEISELNEVSPTEAALTSSLHDYDEVETFHESTTSPKRKREQNATLETVSAIYKNSPDHPTTSTEPTSIDERNEAPSPQGFLDLLSSALAAPPMLDDNKGPLDDETMVKGTLGSPLPVDWTNEVRLCYVL